MARNLNSNGPGHNSGVTVVEKPFFDRIVAIRQHMKALREEEKEVSTEAREADVKITPLKHAVKLYLESEEQRNARLAKESEADRILRGIGPLGAAAVDSTWASETASA
jgi:hypothetical protein